MFLRECIRTVEEDAHYCELPEVTHDFRVSCPTLRFSGSPTQLTKEARYRRVRSKRLFGCRWNQSRNLIFSVNGDHYSYFQGPCEREQLRRQIVTLQKPILSVDGEI